MNSLGLLDSSGNIDPKKIEKELAHALEFDNKYRQTDNMKKRACKVAKSYDEFKEMVAASHLGRLTRKEIESLSDKKKGWHQTSAKSASKPNVLQNELIYAGKRNAKSIPSSSSIPKTSMEFQRNWRRLKDVSAKRQCLFEIGSVHLSALLQKDDDAEVFEDVLRTLVTFFSESEDSLSFDESSLLEWLACIASIDRFSMLIGFVSRDVRNSIVEWLVARDEDDALAQRYRGS